MAIKLTYEDFKTRVDKIFNNTIDLDKFIYINSGTKGFCKCNICGKEWYAVPNSLLNGHGCRSCYDKRNSDSRKITFNEVKKILENNGSDVEIIGEYIDTKHKCRIRCKICGREWETRIGSYLNGNGCKVCRHNRFDTPSFILLLKKIYGDKYLYDNVVYKNNNTKIKLICKKHGEFEILPSTALKKNSEKCQKCIIETKEKIKQEKEEFKKIKNEEKKLKNKVKKEKKERKKITTEEYIEKCKEVYPDEPYDYSITEYIDSNTKVKIKCLKHGIFEKNPYSFLTGTKCPLCARTGHKYTNEEWIKLAKEKYPNFDYSKVNYVNKETQITIICNEIGSDGKIHGEMKVYPNAFLREGKCVKCNKEITRKKKEKEYIEKASKVHKNKYDYSKVFYDGAHVKIKIICPIHGEFEQNPTNHLNGCNCPKCADDIIKSFNIAKKNGFHNIFIERAKKIHDNKYSNEKTIYNGNETKVIITCPEHGDFLQTPHSHLAGGGCPACAVKKIVDSIKLSQEEFLYRVKDVQKYNNYDFSKIIYEGYDKKVIVICPKHGEFSIKAMSLLQGQGCPICKLPKLEKDVRNILIDNNIEFKQQKHFKKWLGRQSLDFYIKEKNIAIECQGLQHFKNERRYQKLEEVQERDRKKKQLCKDNNVHLIYYLPPVFAEYMSDDDIYFTDVNELVDYIKKYKLNE